MLGVTIAILEIIGIYLTFFRAAWIAAALVILVAFQVGPKRLQRLYFVGVIVLALTIAASGPLRKGELHSRATNGSNVNGRLATYVASFHIFERAPIVGVGFSRFAAAEAEVENVTVGGVRPLGYPHSSYFWLLTEQGLIGLLPLVALTFAAWRLVRRLGHLAQSREDFLLKLAAGGAACAYLLMSLTLTMLPEAPPNGFLLVVLGAVAARVDFLSASQREAAPAEGR
jgi:O-antigen ligase